MLPKAGYFVHRSRIFQAQRSIIDRSVALHSNMGSMKSSRTRQAMPGAGLFAAPMMLAVLLLCFFPGIATWLPDLVIGREAYDRRN
ncbi:hypothetical protein RPD_2537 [Rhodopseudomonas palustris BisB5]|uniref:Uncharacterized protein n=1 Tax=Rhodopseudomonas palustris (strain BisB5) TaxID=316057 RepID=Q137H2_RHOPS|nr:hypothetical protein RPD_2537 [Rhodopseudomonas palustris BisB5]